MGSSRAGRIAAGCLALVLLASCSGTSGQGMRAGSLPGVAAPTVGGNPAPSTPAPQATVVGPVAPPGTGGAAPVATTGVPGWVRSGVRISWYSGAASIAQSRYSWVEDSNGPYVDERTGAHYRRTDESGEGQPGAAGDGVSQLDIMDVSGDQVIWSQNLLLNNTSAGGWSSAGSTGGVSTGAPSGAWVDPAQLAGIATQAPAGILVLKGPYPLQGETYQSISFVNPTATAYASYTYDLDTGVLLAATTSTAGAPSTVAAPGEAPPQGNTQLTVTRYLGTRTRTVPGLGGQNPSWVTGPMSLRYGGTLQFANPVDPSSAQGSWPAAMQVSVTPQPGSTWFTVGSSLTTQMPGSTEAKGTGVAGPAGPWWVDPAALPGLTAGTTIDSDPVTGEVLSVTAADGSRVALESKMPGITTTLSYDVPSGRLAGWRQASGGYTLDLLAQG